MVNKRFAIYTLAFIAFCHGGVYGTREENEVDPEYSEHIHEYADDVRVVYLRPGHSDAHTRKVRKGDIMEVMFEFLNWTDFM